MPTSHQLISACPRLSRLAAAGIFLALPAVALQAQELAAPVSETAVAAHAAYPSLNFNLEAALHPSLDLSAASTSSSSEAAVTTDRLNLEAAPEPNGNGNLQPPPRRRRYGRPNYNDRWHNSDGSNRIGFVAGGGFNVPVGSASSDYLGTSYRFEAGAGLNFSQKLAVIFQFDYDRFSVPGQVLRSQLQLYTNVAPGNDFTGLDGNSHIWSFTLNPTLTVHQGEKFGEYVVGGGGFYHKVTNFTIPTTQYYTDYYGYTYQYQANQIIDHYFSNAPGVTGGAGVTYRLSRFSNTKLFAEARYVHTFNKARIGDPNLTGAANGQANNLYPPNSNETSYIPITFGVRF